MTTTTLCADPQTTCLIVVSSSFSLGIPTLTPAHAFSNTPPGRVSTPKRLSHRQPASDTNALQLHSLPPSTPTRRLFTPAPINPQCPSSRASSARSSTPPSVRLGKRLAFFFRCGEREALCRDCALTSGQSSRWRLSSLQVSLFCTASTASPTSSWPVCASIAARDGNGH